MKGSIEVGPSHSFSMSTSVFVLETILYEHGWLLVWAMTSMLELLCLLATCVDHLFYVQTVMYGTCLTYVKMLYINSH